MIIFIFKGTTLTRYMESGRYRGFFDKNGKQMIEKDCETNINAYRIYTDQDFIDCKFQSK